MNNKKATYVTLDNQIISVKDFKERIDMFLLFIYDTKRIHKYMLAVAYI